MANTPLHIPSLVSRGKWNDYRQDIWGDSFNWSWVRPWSQLKYLVIHHTVTKHEATPDDIALLHKARGWAGIGYHFVITKDGVVHYVGDISTARANVANKNEQVIGITMVGDFTKHLPSDDQIRSAHDLCHFFLFESPSLPTLSSWDNLVGHKDLQATACPGTSWPDDMRQRIIDRRVYSAEPIPEPTPQPLPTPEPLPGSPTPEPSQPVYSDPATKIDMGDFGGVMTLGDVQKMFDGIAGELEECNATPKLPDVIVNGGQKIDVGDGFGVGTLTTVRKLLNDYKQDLVDCQNGQPDRRLKQAKDIMFGNGFWFIKYFQLKELLKGV